MSAEIAATASRVLTSREVCRVAGVTYRQVDHWCRRGLLPRVVEPVPGSGYHREFSTGDALDAAVLGELARAGVNPAGVPVQVVTDQGFFVAGVVRISVDVQALLDRVASRFVELEVS